MLGAPFYLEEDGPFFVLQYCTSNPFYLDIGGPFLSCNTSTYSTVLVKVPSTCLADFSHQIYTGKITILYLLGGFFPPNLLKIK